MEELPSFRCAFSDGDDIVLKILPRLEILTQNRSDKLSITLKCLKQILAREIDFSKLNVPNNLLLSLTFLDTKIAFKPGDNFTTSQIESLTKLIEFMGGSTTEIEDADLIISTKAEKCYKENEISPAYINYIANTDNEMSFRDFAFPDQSISRSHASRSSSSLAPLTFAPSQAGGQAAPLPGTVGAIKHGISRSYSQKMQSQGKFQHSSKKQDFLTQMKSSQQTKPKRRKLISAEEGCKTIFDFGLLSQKSQNMQDASQVGSSSFESQNGTRSLRSALEELNSPPHASKHAPLPNVGGSALNSGAHIEQTPTTSQLHNIFSGDSSPIPTQTSEFSRASLTVSERVTSQRKSKLGDQSQPDRSVSLWKGDNGQMLLSQIDSSQSTPKDRRKYRMKPPSQPEKQKKKQLTLIESKPKVNTPKIQEEMQHLSSGRISAPIPIPDDIEVFSPAKIADKSKSESVLKSICEDLFTIKSPSQKNLSVVDSNFIMNFSQVHAPNDDQNDSKISLSIDQQILKKSQNDENTDEDLRLAYLLSNA